MPPELRHVDAWIFDLDNSLYAPSAGIFPQIDARMQAYIARLTGCPPDEARALQKRYFHEHGTTLAGLVTSDELAVTKRRVTRLLDHGVFPAPASSAYPVIPWPPF